MNSKNLRSLLENVQSKNLDIDEALNQLRSLPYDDLGFAKIDHHRELRCGFPEVVFCEGKSSTQIIQVIENIINGGNRLLATRATPEVFEAVKSAISEVIYEAEGRCITHRSDPPEWSTGTVLIITAGTSDIPMAEEARVTATMMDSRVETLYDVGVAGLHRLLEHRSLIFDANVIVVAAGMEGALASVVGGLASCPVIALPTSVGYGASFNGLAPLLTMLNSCAPGVAVVNIDNGFGAGYLASLINRTNESKNNKA